MDLAARPHITAGVALASAAVLAAGPMAQHLPNLQVAQHLPTLSVSDIQLTDASSGLIDLFSGVENELASLVGGAAAAAVPASLAGAALDPTQNLIVQTWMNTFSTAGANLKALYNQWSAIPAPLLQQVLANGIDYGNLYLNPWHTAATAAVKYFTTPTGNNFQPLLQAGLAQLSTGNLTGAYATLWNAFVNTPVVPIAEPLEKILAIPGDIAKNISNATTYLTGSGSSGSGVAAIGLALLDFANLPGSALTSGLQAALNAWNAGDPVGAATNLLNIPGAVTNAVLNTPGSGLISTTGTGLGYALLKVLGIQIPQAIAKSIVIPKNLFTGDPGSVNILAGGSLQAAFQGLVNNLTNGWPSLTPVMNDLNAGLTQVLQSIPSIAANLPSILGNAAGFVSGQIGLLISNLLKLL